jgi:hypothetical protein
MFGGEHPENILPARYAPDRAPAELQALLKKLRSDDLAAGDGSCQRRRGTKGSLGQASKHLSGTGHGRPGETTAAESSVAPEKATGRANVQNAAGSPGRQVHIAEEGANRLRAGAPRARTARHQPAKVQPHNGGAGKQHLHTGHVAVKQPQGAVTGGEELGSAEGDGQQGFGVVTKQKGNFENPVQKDLRMVTKQQLRVAPTARVRPHSGSAVPQAQHGSRVVKSRGDVKRNPAEMAAAPECSVAVGAQRHPTRLASACQGEATAAPKCSAAGPQKHPSQHTSAARRGYVMRVCPGAEPQRQPTRVTSGHKGGVTYANLAEGRAQDSAERGRAGSVQQAQLESRVGESRLKPPLQRSVCTKGEGQRPLSSRGPNSAKQPRQAAASSQRNIIKESLQVHVHAQKSHVNTSKPLATVHSQHGRPTEEGANLEHSSTATQEIEGNGPMASSDVLEHCTDPGIASGTELPGEAQHTPPRQLGTIAESDRVPLGCSDFLQVQEKGGSHAQKCNRLFNAGPTDGPLTTQAVPLSSCSGDDTHRFSILASTGFPAHLDLSQCDVSGPAASTLPAATTNVSAALHNQHLECSEQARVNTVVGPSSTPKTMNVQTKVQRGGRGGGGRSKSSPAAEYQSSGHTFSESGSSMRSSGSGSSGTKSSTSKSSSHDPQGPPTESLAGVCVGSHLLHNVSLLGGACTSEKGGVAPSWAELSAATCRNLHESQVGRLPKRRPAPKWSGPGCSEVGWIPQERDILQRMHSLDAASLPRGHLSSQGASSSGHHNLESNGHEPITTCGSTQRSSTARCPVPSLPDHGPLNKAGALAGQSHSGSRSHTAIQNMPMQKESTPEMRAKGYGAPAACTHGLGQEEQAHLVGGRQGNTPRSGGHAGGHAVVKIAGDQVKAAWTVDEVAEEEWAALSALVATMPKRR